MTSEEQIAHLDRALEIAPERSAYLELRAIYRIDRRLFDLALEDLNRAIDLAERPYLLFLRGLVLCQAERCGEAIADFDAAIAEQPENVQFYRGRALARIEAGMPLEALADADRLVTLAPQQAEAHYARAMALVAQGNDPAALQELDEAVRQRPELVYPISARADCLERLGNRERASADRALVDRMMSQHSHCAVCVDPFRY